MKQRTFEVLYKDKNGCNRSQRIVATSAALAVTIASQIDLLFEVFKRVYVY